MSDDGLQLQLDLLIYSDALACEQLVSGSVDRSARRVPTDPALQPSAATIARFRRKVIETPTCHWFIGAVSDGYGRVCFRSGNKQRTMLAHRFALLAAGYTLADSLIGEHECNETLCVRVHPRHLHVGTQTTNISYAVALGRHRGPLPGNIDPRGRHGRACAIRDSLRDGYDAQRLGEAMRWSSAVTETLF